MAFSPRSWSSPSVSYHFRPYLRAPRRPRRLGLQKSQRSPLCPARRRFPRKCAIGWCCREQPIPARCRASASAPCSARLTSRCSRRLPWPPVGGCAIRCFRRSNSVPASTGLHAPSPDGARFRLRISNENGNRGSRARRSRERTLIPLNSSGHTRNLFAGLTEFPYGFAPAV